MIDQEASNSQRGLNFRFNIHFEHKVNVWVLQLGGWQLLQLSTVDVLLIDRNVHSTLKAIRDSRDQKTRAGDSWWLNHLNKPAPLLNAILCAMEGHHRAPPSFAQFGQELKEVNSLLEAALPNANILRHKDEDLSGAFEILTSQLPRLERETAFLVDVSPLLESRVKRGGERVVEDKILAASNAFGISRQSLICLTALSALYEPISGSEPLIGRGVLKPKPHYSLADAYNAVADIHAIEYLAASIGLDGRTVGMCTRDKYLAALWVNLGCHSPVWVGKTFCAKYTVSKELFPRLTDGEISALFSRLAR